MIAMHNPDLEWRVATTDGEYLTTDQFERRVWQVVGMLPLLGVREGDAIALLAPNCIDYPVIVTGAMRAGVNILPLSTHVNAKELAQVVEALDPKLLIAHGNCLEQANELAGLIEEDITRLLIGGHAAGWDSYYALAAAIHPRVRHARNGRLLLTSGGSTGSQKIVEPPEVSGMEALAAHPDAAALATNSKSVTLITGPLYHAMGALSMTGALDAGGRLVIMDKWNAADFMGAVSEFRITRTAVVPAMMTRILEHLWGEKTYDISSLEVILHGAAPCPQATKLAFMGVFPGIVYEVYGGTEQLVTSVVGPDAWLMRPGTVGRPLTPVVIRDDNGNELPPGKTGVIWGILPPGKPMGYLGRQDETDACIVERDGRTEGTLWDEGYLDPDGFLYITGRKKDMIIVGGENVYPIRIETVLHGHPAVRDAAVVGMPHDTLGEVPAAAVELAHPVPPEDVDALLEEIRNLCATQLAPRHVPRLIVPVESLRTPTGKLQKREIRERVLKNR